MIKVKIRKEHNKIKEIMISGHALYDDYGQDIVCAAVSSTVITTINGIQTINDTIDHQQEKDSLTIRVIKEDDITYKLLDSMVNNLEELAKDYKENIKIIIKEG